MKTKDLTFLEAVRALKEGRCDAIKRPGCSTLIKVYKTCLRVFYDLENQEPDSDTFNYTPGMYLEKNWQLINPRPKTEPVEEKRWMMPMGGIASLGFKPHKEEKGQWVTVKYEKEVQEPEVVEFGAIVMDRHNADNGVIYVDGKYIGKRIRCIVED